MFLFLLAVACTEEKQIIENYQLSAEVLDFEEVALGTWESIRFSLTNTGNSDVELRSVSLVDVSANVWDLTWAEVPGLSPGGLTEFEVKFTPLTPLEEYQARIQIRTLQLAFLA